jgi:hypothetical protein
MNAVNWRAARPGHPQRRRNQYTPLIDRPWFLAVGFVAAVLVLLWRAGVFV